MSAPVEGIDEDVGAVVEFVGEALCRDAADDGSRRTACIEYREFSLLSGKCALHGAHDVAALAQRSQNLFRVVVHLPSTRRAFLGDAELGQALQAAEQQRPSTKCYGVTDVVA